MVSGLMKVFSVSLLSLFFLSPVLQVIEAHSHGSHQKGAIAKMVSTTNAFLDSLDRKQLAMATMPFADDERFNWKFVPADRKGINFKYLDDEQERLVHNLLKAFLSADGYWKTTTIIDLEVVLFEKEGAARRDTDLYYVSVFGKPSLDGKWGLRFEGHHLSLNYTIVDGKFVATAPTFWGANPATVREGSRKGIRALAKEEDLARELLHSFDSQQRADAILRKEAFRDILTGTDVKVDPFDFKGVAMSNMNESQRALLLSLIREYTDNMPEAVAKKRFSALKKAGLDSIRFAWAGGTHASEKHYYRIQGPTFLVEYDNIQNQGNHIHSVWRDFDGDFGRDLIREHYQAHAH